MLELINTENIWGYNSIRGHKNLYGDARNVNGGGAYLFGDISGFSGCCSNIAGDLTFISKITRDLDKLQEIMKKHSTIRLCVSGIGKYKAVIWHSLIIDGEYRTFPSVIKISESSLERVDDILKNKS